MGLNSSGDSNSSDNALFWELMLGVWTGLEAGVQLLLTDFELLVRGRQGGLKGWG